MNVPEAVEGPQARPVRRVGWLFGVLALLTIPWTIFLAMSLPTSRPAAHYDLAWAGFDTMLVLALLATAWAAVRTTAWLPPVAAMTGTLVLVDAWFDVVTAPTPQEFWLALGMAVLVEVPLAGLCLWLAVTGQQLVRRALLWRGRRSARRGVPAMAGTGAAELAAVAEEDVRPS